MFVLKVFLEHSSVYSFDNTVDKYIEGGWLLRFPFIGLSQNIHEITNFIAHRQPLLLDSIVYYLIIRYYQKYRKSQLSIVFLIIIIKKLAFEYKDDL